MQSVSTSRVTSASELSAMAKERAMQGQPTSSPVYEEPAVAEPRMGVPRVVARAVTRAPSRAPAPTPAPSLGQIGQVAIGRNDASLILQGLSRTLDQVDAASATGWSCTGVSQATIYQGRDLRGRLQAFIADPTQTSFSISASDLAAADQILGCSNEATASTPNTSAYIALGVIVAASAIFFAVVGWE